MSLDSTYEGLVELIGEPSEPGLLFFGGFYLLVWVFLLVIVLFRFSTSSWFSPGSLRDLRIHSFHTYSPAKGPWSNQELYFAYWDPVIIKNSMFSSGLIYQNNFVLNSIN